MTDFLGFLVRTLKENWVRNLMACIETTKLSVIWNEELLEWISPMRGIRQGDPISPYIFVLCMERLGHIIDRSIARGD